MSSSVSTIFKRLIIKILHLTNGELLSAFLRCGVIAIPLNTTGSGQSGIRVCVSRLLTDEDFQLLDDHLKLFVRLVNGEV